MTLPFQYMNYSISDHVQTKTFASQIIRVRQEIQKKGMFEPFLLHS